MNTLSMNFRRRSFSLLALLLMGGIASAQVTIRGSVYGGGEGLDTIVRAGWVTGNTTVTMNGGTVERSIYGGGQFGSVGTYTEYDNIQVPDTLGNLVNVPVPKSNSRVAGTGLAKVVMRGGFLGGRGSLMPDADSDPNDDDRGWIFCGSRGEADSITYPRAIALGVVDSTYLFVGDTAVVTASVYGGCENGLVLGNTHVVIADSCQIGTGYKGLVSGVHTWDERYSKAMWEAAIEAVRAGDSTAIAQAAANFHECDHWPYGDNSHYDIYDIFYGEGSYNPDYSCDTMGSNGHSFFGNVFGGGSGFYPIAPGVWRRTAGQVNGNTLVEITGGHILTSVYGGNEVNDVKGKSTVKMSGGTLGVPRTLENIAANPIPCYLFGGGMGDPRTAFNAWTNVGSTEIDITGGTIFGSVFGGGEEGHVLGNVSLTVRDSINGTETISPHIGTWGYSYVDGNVFGAGRGFSGAALAAGGVGGNTEVNIEGGTMLGSIYGGGRLASVGANFVAPQIVDPSNLGSMIDNPAYGQLQEGDDHGFTTVNITGGTIGNTFEIEADSLGNYLGGNVFGGSMGRMTLLNGSPNPIWENLAKVKQTTVHIDEATANTLVIKGHVYGGGEFGCVEKNTLVDIDKGTIGAEVTVGIVEHRLGGNVYGGGKGTPKAEKAGLVKGNAYVDMSNGNVHRSIYGGGEFASVGTFTEYYEQNPPADHFVGEPITCESGTGLTSVIVSGGQVGLSHALMPTPGTSAVDDDFGYIFAGGRGTNDPVAYPKANILAVVDSTYLEISDSTYLVSNISADQTLINASIYGGCENGLVLRDTKVLVTGGQIGNGYNKTAGTWDGVYPEAQWTDVINAIKADNPVASTINGFVEDFNECDAWDYSGSYLIYDIFADSTGYDSHGGTVNNATDGNSFFGNVFGGGSGYYPYAPGQWRRTAGRVYGNTNVEIVGGHILTSVFGGGEIADVMGTSSVKMTGGTVGVPQTKTEIEDHPLNSHVFGGGKGDSRGALFNGWTNVDSTNVYITGGVVFGSVFGGGEDGHVLRNTCVTIKDEGTSSPLVGTWGTTTYDGNVFGGGRGLSANAIAAGAVGGNTNLAMDGGRVLGSVYGGGRMASVGIQLEGANVGRLKEDDGNGTYGYTFVNIEDGNIGSALETKTIEEHRISGNVYGGSKGGLFKLDLTTMNPQWPSLGKVKQTNVQIDGSSLTDLVIKGDVFGGGEIGTVRDSTQVVVSGGTLERDLFGGGYGSTSKEIVANCDSTNMTPVMIAGRVYGRTDATVSGGLVKHNVYGGGEFAKVGMDVNSVTTIRQSTVSLNGGVVGSHVPGVTVADTLFSGMVYGGGKGILADTTVAMVLGSTYIYDTVSNNSSPAHVLGDIHGAGELALVQKNTNLTIGSAEVGTMANATSTETKTLPDGTTVTLYQTRALEGGRVFGGGQGVEDVNYRHAALVMGNTNTEITGTAQINGSVYGGGDLANVGSATTLDELDNDKNTGSATVVISGGTIGPLNGSQSNGNVFGGGRGAEDMQNEIYYATVDSTHVVISGNASIAGSVFGGGANGRVLGNASTDIQGGTIGTTGLTEWDGNVYGGGRNLYAYANTTAAVFGNTDIQMSGGTIKANMYGGGRFGSVGMNYNTGQTSIDTIQGADHGYVTINITGGTIGDAYVQYLGTYNADDPDDDMPRTGYVFGGGRGIMEADKIDKLGNVKGTHVTVGGTAKVLSSVYGGGERGIVYDSTYVKMTGNAEVGVASETMALHRGDVYGGGCGYDSIWNATENKYVFLHEAGSVKGNTRIEMDGSKVYGNIFGAGRLTDVLGHASVIISGGEVGWSRTDAQILNKPDFGYVYTAGRGEPQERFKEWTTVDSTYAEVSGGHIWSSLNGGGEEGHVNRNTHVVVKGGTIGTRGTTGNDGNVFGAGRGKHPIITGVASAAVSGNTQVDIQDGRIMGSVFGGGNRGSVGVCYTPITIDGQAYQIGDTIQGTDHGYTLVNVSGGQIGHEDTDGRTGGNVYGGSRGVVVDPAITTVYQNMANVKQTEVNIFEASGKETFIMGSVFGGGEDGHVFKDTYVNVSDGQIGGSAYSSSPALCSDRHHGNVYGGGRGLDTYTGTDNQEHYSTTAGKVYGNTNVLITGGYITRNVYGGGNLSTVGIADEDPTNGVYKTGLAKVTITGGTVGILPDLTNVNGMVFGSARGMAGEAYKDLAMVKNTEVLITGDAQIKGSVFGSGEDGHTRMRTNVFIGDTILNGISYSANDLVIGTNGITGIDGNVYGGGRGLDIDQSTGTYSSTAGITGISTNVLVNDGLVKGSVFGGGRLASVGYEAVLDALDNGNIVLDNIPTDYGRATVHITGDATIGAGSYDNGHVFGSGRGDIGDEFKDLAYVHWTDVTVDGNAQVNGSVFGGGMDGHVKKYTPKGHTDVTKFGDTHVTIGALTPGTDVCNIATGTTTSQYKGNVYGGGRGFDLDPTGTHSPTAGRVEGNTKVDILSGNVWHHVFGGGNQAVVMGRRVVNIVNGEVHEDVHGGSNAIPVPDDPEAAALWAHSGLKTVNVRGGHIYGSVYGCSNTSNDGEVEQTTENAKKWTSFVNINGGQIDESVHGAGYAGTVNGSVCVNIGANAILNAPNHRFNIDYNKAHTGLWTDTDPAVEPTAKTLVIGGSVYGGSDYYGSTPTNDWSHYDVTGYALIFIDGAGYNTAENSGSYMTINGGLFGSGTHTESGALGRHILLKDYGTRDADQMTSASRELTTIQRANNVIIDHANVKLSGLADISNTANPNKYGVMRVSDTLAVINAGGIVLGSATAGGYAHMDSIRTVQSLNFANSSASIYDHNLNELDKHSWYWVGINKESNPAKLYNISGTGDEATLGSELTFDKENVVIYNDTSKLWVRYHANSKQYYGELLGFFRMKGEYYIPTQKERESFAYARPKISQEPGITEDNKADGGWLSYNENFNYFTDEGNIFTKTIQYPYINVLEYSKGDRKEYRMWVDPQQGNRWYVDGVRGWGQDKLKSQDPQAGRYPDKPKKTLFGSITDGGVTTKSGIISEAYPVDLYSYKDHLIYVVGALSAEDEAILVRDTTLTEEGVTTRYPLKLYRYPGGHKMSNDSIDFGGGKTPSWGVPSGTSVGYKPSHAGPGANYGAMLDVQANAQVNLRGVELDGLYGYDDDEKELHMIPTTYAADSINFHPEEVTMPLVVTGKNSELGLKQFTVLKRGYNSTNANVWYTDSDYTPYNGSGDVTAYHGGALFVDSLATVSLFGTDSISIVDNMQYLKIGDADATAIESNVYLPTFRTSLRISEQLDDDTHIGITSPKRNDKPSYKQNTLSPVAYTLNGNHAYANAAYTNENFYDDLGWFFVNENKTTYYDPYIDEGKFNDTLYFGWTWANVVRSKPDSYVESTTGGRITVEDERGLAWLISKSAGMNGETATNFAGDTINQIGDANLKQYVWVPIGTDSHPFSGKYDGNGHLITDLDIDYIGKLDKIYQRSYYGMFGKVSNDTINRTFVVSGYIHPVNSVLTDMDTTFIGGLVGYLDGVKAVISNSEAADTIDCPNYPTDHKVVAGGLVARMNNGHIHSSMTMPLVKVGNLSEGKVGGLVGMSKAGTIYNSFVNGSFIVSTSNGNVKVGGLLGDNTNATMRNCYMALREIEGLTDNGLTTSNFGSIAVSNSSSASNIDSCYVMQSDFNFTLSNSCDASCKKYTPVIGADNLGYMWADNKVEGISSKTDTTLFQVLNKSVKWNNRNGNVYARWARAGIPEINNDLPVLMLSEFDEGMDRYQGGFRSVGTYAGSPSLQYGGPTRDPKVGSADNELDAAFTRPQVNTERKDCLFVYGDVNSVGVSNAANITQGKVSIYEHASIKSVGALAQFENTYVGVTFDNSYGNAHSTPGMNYGLYGMGGYLLPRDWHMFSSPLKDAPQGFDYKGHNTNTYTSGDFDSDAHFNNPWVYNDDEHEFLWLQSNNSTNIRYWMYGWDNSQSQALNQSLNSSTWQDGYFPSSVSNLHTIGGNCIPGTDEYGRYPYGMDFYTWYEPQYHWINFKRNGPNHWHSDENEATRHHDHLDYYGDGVNVNEEKLITGRGYMAAISVPTFMQSHGAMNNNSNGIGLTMDGTYCTGWNLVGNPYHGYLDFDKFANINENYLVQMDTSTTDTPKTSPFYLIYDADRYEEGQEGTGFLYYPRGGSQNGAYANRYLHPHQGFFVLAQGTGPLSFTSDMVATRDEVKQDSLFRDWQPNYPLVNLYLSSDKGCNDVTVIEFERPEWGGATKLRELRQGNGLFYGYHEGHRYAALFTKVGTPRVPLWFEAKEDDIFTMKWNTANGDFSSLYLIDNLTGVQYDMLANDTYVFEGHKEDYYSRFYIVFDVTGVEEYEGDDNFVFFDGSQWVVTGDGDLDFIDMQGRELWKGRVSGQSRVSMPKVAAGVYLFRLVNSNNVKIQKVIVEKH